MFIGILIFAFLLQQNPFSTDAPPEFVVKQFTISDGLPLNAVQRMVQTQDGFLFITTFDGLVRFDGYEFMTMNMLNAPGLATNRLRNIGIDADGVIWVASPYGNLSSFDGFEFTNHDQTNITELPVFTGSDAIPDQVDLLGSTLGNAIPFLEDFDLSSSGKTIRIDSTQVVIDRQIVLANQELRGGFEDNEGTVWIYTRNNGLFQIKESQVRNFNGSDNFRFRNTYSISQSTPDEIWVQGFSYFAMRINLKTAEVENFSLFEGSTEHAQFLFADPFDGSIYASTETFPLWLWENERWERASWFEETGIESPAIVSGMYRYSENLLLIGTTGGLVIRNGASFFRIEEKTGQPVNRARTFASLPDGTLLIGTNGNGLYRLNPANWQLQQYRTENGLSSNFIRDIHITAPDTIWLATQDRGLNRIIWDDAGIISQTVTLGTAQGLLNHGLHRIIPDGHGYLWMNSNGGIMRFSEENLNAYANRETSQLFILKLTDEQGLRNNEGNGGVSNAGARLHNGLIVFPNQVGLVIVKPDEFLETSADNLNRPLIDRVMFNAQSLQAGLFETLTLPRGNRDFRVSFTLPNFKNPGMIAFTYRLEGLHSNWRSPVSGRTAVFTNVPPGQYLFRVQASGPDGIPVIATLTIVVPHYFYETVWFMILCGFLFLGLIFVAHRYRTQQLRAREMRTRSLLELQTCYVIRTDLNGQYTYANPKFLDTFGFLYKNNQSRTIEYLGANIASAVHKSDRVKVRNTLAELLQNPGTVIQVDIRKPLPNGKLAYTLWDFSVIFKANGKPEEIQGVGIDYTQRKEQERLLRESEHKLQRTIESVPHPMLIVDQDLIIQSVNNEFVNVFEYSDVDVIGQPALMLLPEAPDTDRLHRIWEFMQKDDKPKRMPGFQQALTKSGREIHILLSLNHFHANDRKLTILILQDVSELKMRQDVILKQNQTLRDIAWHQSHVVRRPVANILGLIDLIQNYPEESQEQQTELLEMLKKTTRELDDIVKELVRKSNESEFLED